MKKVKVISIVAVCLMALVFVSCEDGVTSAGGPEAALNGTWVYSSAWGEHVIIFNNGNFEERENGTPFSRATYTISGNYLIVSRTHIHGMQGFWVWDWHESRDIEVPLGSRWYSRTELISAVRNHLRSIGLSEWRISDAIRDVEEIFSPMVVTFYLSGNVLLITSWGETTTYIRRN